MAGGEKKFGLLNKVYFLLVLTIGLILVPVISFAQDLPDCGGDGDPYDTSTCPLDNYIWLSAIIALLAGAVYIYKQQNTRAGF